jgi:SAM-dependent methyltransferase
MELFAAPEPPTPRLEDCYFYHSMDIPGCGSVTGEWDLRGHEAEYLGHLPLEGKRVLELGTASGYLCAYMESIGASVVAYDLSPDQSWDIVPNASGDFRGVARERKAHIAALNAGWWLNWKARGLKASMVYGSAYQVPAAIGEVDVVTFGSILVHLRDPFLALWNGARLSKSSVIVTDVFPRRLVPLRAAIGRIPVGVFGPGGDGDQWGTWWWLSPRTVQRMLSVLGFEKSTVSYHNQLFQGRSKKLYTVVAHRTAGQPDLAPVP